MTSPEERAEKLTPCWQPQGTQPCGCPMCCLRPHVTAQIKEAVEEAFNDPKTRIYGLTKTQILELEHWRMTNNIPTLWVDLATLEPTVAVLLRSAKAAAYEDASKIAERFPKAHGGYGVTIANRIRARAKELEGNGEAKETR